MGLGQRWCISALNMTSGGNNFNDFPVIQLNKFRANTAELIP